MSADDHAPEQAPPSSDAGVGGAVHEESTPTDAGTVDAPVLGDTGATAQEKIEGILAQTRVDLGDESEDRYAEVLRQRFSDSEIQVPDSEVASLARRSRSGGQ